MPAPTLSVLLPNYNHADFLPKCLDEILAQSFTDFELIIIDDASTDDSVRVIEEYARRDDRIRFFKNEQNRGVVYTLNRCLDLARGEFAHGAASDDYVLPGYFSEAVGLLRDHPTAGLATGIVDCVDDSGKVLYRGPGMWADEPCFLHPDELVKRVSDCGVPGPAVWRREQFLAAGGYKPELKWHCDWFALQVVAFRHGVCFLPRTTAIVRVTPEAYSASGQKKAKTQRPVLQRMLTELAAPQYADVIARIGLSGTFRQFGPELVRAAATMGDVPPPLVSALRETTLGHAQNLIHGGEPEMRAAVARFLARLGRDAYPFYRSLTQLTKDPEPVVRAGAADARRMIAQVVPLHVRVRSRVKQAIARAIRVADRVARPLHHDRMQRLEAQVKQLTGLNEEVVALLRAIHANLERSAAAPAERTRPAHGRKAA